MGVGSTTQDYELYPELFPELALEYGEVRRTASARPVRLPPSGPSGGGTRLLGAGAPAPSVRQRSAARARRVLRLRRARGLVGRVQGFEAPEANFDACAEVHIFDGFETGDYRLRTHHYARLVALAQALTARAGSLGVSIDGHTDSVGDPASNDGLSLARAFECFDYFRDFTVPLGSAIPAQIRGFGAADPIADNATAVGRRRNRRIEIWICPLVQPGPVIT